MTATSTDILVSRIDYSKINLPPLEAPPSAEMFAGQSMPTLAEANITPADMVADINAGLVPGADPSAIAVATAHLSNIMVELIPMAVVLFAFRIYLDKLLGK